MGQGEEKVAQLPADTNCGDDKEEEGLDTPIDCWTCRKGSCRMCCCSFNNYWKSLGWLTIIFGYLLLGGLFFSLAEQPAERARNEAAVAARQELRTEVDQLVLVIVNNSNLTVQETRDFLEGFVNASQRLNDAIAETEISQVWDFASSVFFCVTVITTIGEAS